MKIEHCPHLGPTRARVSSITYEPVKNFMFRASNIIRRVRFGFQNIFRSRNAFFAQVLTVAKAMEVASVATSKEQPRPEEMCRHESSPTRDGLRERPRVRQDTSQRADGGAALQFAIDAFVSAHISVTIERNGECSLPAIIERHERLLAQAPDDGARNIAHTVLIGCDVSDSPKIDAWRAQAAELRAAADRFVIPTAQEALRRAAGNYDMLADDAEALAKRASALVLDGIRDALCAAMIHH